MISHQTEVVGTGPPSWPSLLSELAAFSVAIPERLAVQLYMAAHPDILDPTLLLCRHARQEFGPSASLSLQLNRDREIEDKYPILMVRLLDYSNDTMRRIDSVMDRSEDSLEGTSGTILVTTDFRPIR